MVAPLAYIALQFKNFGSFFSEWKNLPDKDKDELKQWATEEQEAMAK